MCKCVTIGTCTNHIQSQIQRLKTGNGSWRKSIFSRDRAGHGPEPKPLMVMGYLLSPVSSEGRTVFSMCGQRVNLPMVQTLTIFAGIDCVSILTIWSRYPSRRIFSEAIVQALSIRAKPIARMAMSYLATISRWSIREIVFTDDAIYATTSTRKSGNEKFGHVSASKLSASSHAGHM